MRKSNLERLREAKRSQAPEAPAEMGLEELLKLLVDGSRPPEQRRLNPTQLAAIFSPERQWAYMGPAGVAKTSTLCAAGLIRALLQPGSKGLVARADYNDLMDTTKLRLEEMIALLPKGILIDRDKSPPEKWWIQPVPIKLEDGTIDDRPSQITFMGLKDTLGSYEFNWAIIDEAAEVEEARIHEVNSRLRNRGGNYAVMLAFNPPAKTHWLYTACTGRDYQDRKVNPPWLTLFTPEPNENARNLPPDYHERLAKTLPEDMRQRLVYGQWGSTFVGAPVYREFRYELHAPATGVQWDGQSPLLRFWDFGYNRPACIWAYLDGFGRLKHIHAELGEKVEARTWAQKCKAITAQKWPGAEVAADFGDPAVKQQKDTGSTLAEFAKEGIIMRFRVSRIEQGLQIMRQKLGQMVEGQPLLQFDRRGCAPLIESLRGGYRLDERGEKPVKDGHYDHLADAERYGILNLFATDFVPQFSPGAGYSGSNVPDNLAYRREFDNGI